jgi:hypothetical protein
MKHPSSSSRRAKPISKKAASTTQNPAGIRRDTKKWTNKGVASKRTVSRLPARTIGFVDNPPQPPMDHADGLSDLVWKYFESEIREALIEVQTG